MARAHLFIAQLASLLLFAVPLPLLSTTARTPNYTCLAGTCPLLTLTCQGEICVPDDLGKPCSRREECGVHTACSPRRVCAYATKGAFCDDYDDCSLGLTCTEKGCMPGLPGAKCGYSGNCETVGYTCGRKGTCVPGEPGFRCLAGNECVSGDCRALGDTAPTCQEPGAAAGTRDDISSSDLGNIDVSGASVGESNADIDVLNGEFTSSDVETALSGILGGRQPNSDVLRESPEATSESGSDPQSAGTCIGRSSHSQGVAVLRLISERPVLRKQFHPRRALSLRASDAILMLCHKFDDGEVCATPSHVVRYRGTIMHMHEMCHAHVLCDERFDVPVNFKGPCGEHLEFSKHLQITQHASSIPGISAIASMDAECHAMRTTWLRWLVTTL